MKIISSRAAMLTGITAAALTAAHPTCAQVAASPGAERPSDQVGEIIVTAQKRSESIQKVPLSVSAVDSQEILKTGANALEDIFRNVPGLVVTDFGGRGQNTIAVRGVYAAAGDPTTAIYIDDVPLPQQGSSGSEQGAAEIALFDLNRIEVLRGPQGTLYGSGAMGGLLKYVTNQPDPSKTEVLARARVGFTEGGAPSYLFGGVLNVPLVSDRIAFRGGVQYTRDGGWIDRVANSLPFSGGVSKRNVNDITRLSVRGALSIMLDDSFTITPAVYYQRNRTGDYTGFIKPLPNYETDYRGEQFVHDDYLLATLTANKDFKFGKLTAVGSYYTRELTQQRDYTKFTIPILAGALSQLVDFGILPPGSEGVFNNDGFTSRFTPKQERYTGELRLSSNDNKRLRWNVGVYATDTTINRAQTIDDPNAITSQTAAFGAPIVIPGIVDLNTTNFFRSALHIDVREFALFTDETLAITDRLGVSAGVRYFDNRRKQARTASGLFNGGTTVTPETRVSENGFTPRFSINYQVTPRNLLYASAARGYRSGFPQGTVPVGAGTPVVDGIGGVGRALVALGFKDSSGRPVAPSDVNPDYLWSYEIGSKNELFDHRLRLNASLFYIDWSRIQQSVTLVDPLTGNSTGFGVSINGPQAVSRGGEAEFDAAVTRHFGLGGGISYTDAHFTKNLPAAAGGTTDPSLPRKDERVQYIPQWTTNVHAEYTFDIARNTTSTLRSEVQWRSEAFRTFNPADVNYRLPPYAVLNLRASVRRGPIELAAFANNVTGSAPILDIDSSTAALGLLVETTLRPRTFGLEANARF